MTDVLFDEVDQDLASLKLTIIKSGRVWYATRRYGKRTRGMHRVVLERMLGRVLGTKEHVDHINNNGLDNRRSNLRLSTIAQNQHNAKISSANSSGYKGVSFDRKDCKWAAHITKNCKLLSLGRFVSIVDAALAYDKAAVRLRGEFAKTNYPAFAHTSARLLEKYEGLV